jgi:hypothetical protein
MPLTFQALFLKPGVGVKTLRFADEGDPISLVANSCVSIVLLRDALVGLLDPALKCFDFGRQYLIDAGSAAYDQFTNWPILNL